jgi:hypothetical protein
MPNGTAAMRTGWLGTASFFRLKVAKDLCSTGTSEPKSMYSSIILQEIRRRGLPTNACISSAAGRTRHAQVDHCARDTMRTIISGVTSTSCSHRDSTALKSKWHTPLTTGFRDRRDYRVGVRPVTLPAWPVIARPPVAVPTPIVPWAIIATVVVRARVIARRVVVRSAIISAVVGGLRAVALVEVVEQKREGQRYTKAYPIGSGGKLSAQQKDWQQKNQ